MNMMTYSDHDHFDTSLALLYLSFFQCTCSALDTTIKQFLRCWCQWLLRALKDPKNIHQQCNLKISSNRNTENSSWNSWNRQCNISNIPWPSLLYLRLLHLHVISPQHPSYRHYHLNCTVTVKGFLMRIRRVGDTADSRIASGGYVCE